MAPVPVGCRYLSVTLLADINKLTCRPPVTNNNVLRRTLSPAVAWTECITQTKQTRPSGRLATVVNGVRVSISFAAISCIRPRSGFCRLFCRLSRPYICRYFALNQPGRGRRTEMLSLREREVLLCVKNMFDLCARCGRFGSGVADGPRTGNWPGPHARGDRNHREEAASVPFSGPARQCSGTMLKRILCSWMQALRCEDKDACSCTGNTNLCML